MAPEDETERSGLGLAAHNVWTFLSDTYESVKTPVREGIDDLREVVHSLSPEAIWERFQAITETILDFFIIQSATIWAAATKLVPDMVTRAWVRIWDDLFLVKDEGLRAQMMRHVERGWFDEEDIDAFVEDWRGFGPLKPLILQITMLFFHLRFWKIYSDTTSSTVVRNTRAKFTPETLDVSTAIRGLFVAPELAEEWRIRLLENGLDARDQELSVISNHRLFDENRILDLWFRKILSETEAKTALAQLGFTPKRIDDLFASWEWLPSIQDLFTLVSKEAFEPDAIRTLGLDAEFPEDMVLPLEKQGVTRDWAQKFWYAHWQMPSILQGFEMFHRSVITGDQLDELFKTVELPPFWRDKLTEIAYRPFTRVDVRRMHQLGVLDDSELIRAYLDIGYNEEKAGALADFTKKYNTRGERELTKTELLRGYRNKELNKRFVTTSLRSLGYSEENAEYFVTHEDFVEAQELREDLIDTIRAKFVKNIITTAQTRIELMSLDLRGDRIDLLLSKWETKREVNTRRFTKSDLDRLLREQILEPLEYKEELTRLGYSEDTLAQHIALVSEPIPRNDLNDFFAANIITAEQYREQMINLGFDNTKIDWYVALLTPTEVRPTEKLIARTDLNKMRVEGVINASSWRSGMVDLGYSSEQVDLYYELLTASFPEKLVEEFVFTEEEVDLTKQIPKTDLLKFYTKRLITEEQFYERMRLLGFTDEKIDLYVELFAAAIAGAE